MTHTFSPSILRAYDIRGIVGETLHPKDAYFVGRGFATRIQREGGDTVCVGRDGRLSSPEMQENLIRGLQEGGINVIDVGLGPTPLVYFAMHHFDADAAVMVTGSHNPANYNGFKMCLRQGPMFDADIQALGQTVADGALSTGTGSYQAQDARGDYLAHLLTDFQTHYPQARPLKIAWDPGNGAAGEVLETLVDQLPGEHILLNITIDGTFPAHHPDPVVAENVQQLQQVVCEQSCDLGIAFDGDGDRIGVLDGQGRMIFGDLLLTLFAKEVLATHPGAPILVDVKASQTFFEEIKRLKGLPTMGRTGHSIIKAKMKEINCPLAGEMSGHMFFADRYFGFDDALYAALRLIGIVASQNHSLSSWCDNLPQRFTTPEVKINCPDTEKFKVVELVAQQLKEKKAQLNDIDGVRVSNQNGWWLLRASNTQSALVARMESETQAGVQALQHELEQYLQPFGLKVS